MGHRFVSSVPPWYIHATRPLNVHLLLALSGFWPCLGCGIAQHPNDSTCSHKQLPADCDPMVFPAWMRPFAQDSLLFRIWTTLWYSNGDSAGQWTPTQRLNISPVAALALDVDFLSVYLAFNWDFLVTVGDTDFPVLCEWKVQGIAAGLLTRLPFHQITVLPTPRPVLVLPPTAIQNTGESTKVRIGENLVQ